MAISQRLENAALNLLKANVGNLKPSKEIEEYMTSCVLTAAANLADAKIALSDELPDDAHLHSMYAAWLYRNRAAGTAKPEMLRSSMRNRQVTDATTEGAT